MSAETKIQWTDRTWNPVRGCSLVSEGCRSCYAMKQAHRFSGPGKAYEGLTELGPNGPRWTGKIRLVPEALTEPFRWREPQKIFVNSMSDLFHEDVPEDFIVQTFAVMAVTAGRFWSGRRNMQVGTHSFQGKTEPIMSFGEKYGPHTYQVLTKRPERMRALVSSRKFQVEVSRRAYDRAMDRLDAGYLMDRIQDGRLWPLPNVWVGVSCENQDTLERIDILKDVPAAVRFVSFEPLLEDLRAVILDRIHWAIIGGESGPKARPMNVQWVRSLLEQCQEQKVAPFVKQMGSNAQERNDYIADVWYYADGSDMDTEALDADSYRYQGTPVRLKLKDGHGGNMLEWPEELRVREFPVL